VIESIIEGTVDAGPLDAYWHALLRGHEPQTASALRTIAHTDETPIPCFVASSETPEPVRERLAQAFADSGHEAALRDVLADLALAGFERTDIGVYESLKKQARDVDALGYARLA
jgi:ABC-type phosphate/phosphonate transport system substrate-binding protein